MKPGDAPRAASRQVALQQARRWVILLALSLAFVAFLEILHVPAAFLLGPMISAILLAIRDRKVFIPEPVWMLAQAVIGCMIARSIPLTILSELYRDWPIFLAGVLSVVIAAPREADAD